MQIRKLLPEEHVKTRFLYEEVFTEDSQAFVDYYYTEKIKDNEIYVVEEDGGIRAMLHLNPYQMMVNGEKTTVHYIVAVATQETYRKRGYMAALLEMALQDMYHDGELFTYLMPASEAIYFPYDFRTVYEQKIPWCDSEKKQERQMEVLTEDRCKVFSDWAQQLLSDEYQVYAFRDQEYYKRLIKEFSADDGEILFRSEDGKITGCGYYYPSEMAEKSKIMVRIVDVRRMLMSLKLKTLTAVCFTITDPLIPENNRCITITGTEYSGVLLMDGLQKNSEGTIPISALTSLLFGARSVDEICELEDVSMSERMKGEMKKFIPLKKLYLNEMV